MNINNEHWTQAVDAVLKKASADQTFLAKCQNDPAGAFQDATGLVFPEEKRAEFAQSIARLQGANELSDEHLDLVAGGNMTIKNPKSPFPTDP